MYRNDDTNINDFIFNDNKSNIGEGEGEGSCIEPNYKSTEYFKK